MRPRKLHDRSRLVLSLPRLTPDERGMVKVGDFEQYHNTLSEWARNVTAELEQRAIIDRFEDEGSSIIYSANGVQSTDMNLTNVPLLGGYFYGVHVNSTIEMTGANGRWTLDVAATGPLPSLGRVHDQDTDAWGFCDGWRLWRQPADAVIDISLMAFNVLNIGSLRLAAGAGIPRTIEVVGFGAAPTLF